MSKLLLALVLVASAEVLADDGSDSREPVSCSMRVSVTNGNGQLREVRRVSASSVASVVIQGRVSLQERDTPALLFDVYNPHGRRYQVLLATPRVVVSERDGHRVKKVSKTREATLAVAGSSIALTSMYGKWRVEPRLEGTDKACGQPEYFTIRP